MAIYYLHAQIIGRSAGRSATGAAAYRAGERLHDERTGLTYDYTRRRGDIETEIMAPAGAPAWAQERECLWNEVEKAERRGDAQVAREIVVAIPIELNRDQQRDLVREYVQEQFVARGMVADVAIHRNPGNPHAHILLTMREMGPEGLASKKNREWNRPELLEQWREQWAVNANRALERAGHEQRIDHRSLVEQGTERLPQVHLGPHAHALEKRGIATEKGEHNRAVAEHNAVVIDLEQAREAKKRLEVEKAVTDRYTSRLKDGWDRSHAIALGQLEFDHGGGALTAGQLRGLRDGWQAEQREIAQAVQAIEKEGRRLAQATEIHTRLRETAETVDRLKSPIATVKRWFSSEAREEYKRALGGLQGCVRAAENVGSPTPSDLAAQQSAWQRERARQPSLEKRGESLSNSIQLAVKALEGFAWEHDVQREWDLRRRRTQSRGDDRGR